MSRLTWLRSGDAGTYWRAYVGDPHDGLGIIAGEVYELGIGSGDIRWRFSLGDGRYSIGIGRTTGQVTTANGAKGAVELRFRRFLAVTGLSFGLDDAERRELESLRGRLAIVRGLAGRQRRAEAGA